MSNQYINNSEIYQANAERDIFIILSRFNTEYIYDIIDNALLAKNNTQLIMSNPNLIKSLEHDFTLLQASYPDDKANILECREETYIEIINYLCSKFNLQFNNNDEVDLYTAAYYLYEFLVGNYLVNISTFFGKYILQEKDSLYKSFNLDKFKKTSNINHGKRIFKDNITSTILLQTAYIIDQLMSFDFDFETIVGFVYNDNEIARFISSIFYDNGDFYNFYKQDINNSFIRPNIITNIRLFIQNACMSEDSFNFIKEG